MKLSTKIIKYVIAILIGISTLSLSYSAKAANFTAGPLEISYAGEKVFDQGNIAPGDFVSKTLTIVNNGNVSHNFAIATKNVSGDLAERFLITPIVGNSKVWSVSVQDLSALSDGSRTVTSLRPGETKTVILKADFAESNGDSAQGQTANFDFIFGTEEAEPSNLSALGTRLSRLSTQTPSETSSVSPQPSATSTSTETAQVKGEQTNTEDSNPMLLLIAPAAVLATAIFIPEFLFVAGVTALAAGVTTILGAHSVGTMPFGLFEILVGAEIAGLLIASYFMLHHDNRVSRKIKGHKHRLRIR